MGLGLSLDFSLRGGLDTWVSDIQVAHAGTHKILSGLRSIGIETNAGESSDSGLSFFGAEYEERFGFGDPSMRINRPGLALSWASQACCSLGA